MDVLVESKRQIVNQLYYACERVSIKKNNCMLVLLLSKYFSILLIRYEGLNMI